MKVEVSSQGIQLNFKLLKGNPVNFNRLKFQMGIENVQSNPFDSKQFSIDHLVYFGIEATINQIIKEKKSFLRSLLNHFIGRLLDNQ